jgi:MFS family permease
MNQPKKTASEEWKAHWPLVLSAMVGFSFFTVVTYGLGAFTGPLEKEFGWTRAETYLGLTVFGLIQMFGGPPVGMLLDKIGSRGMAIGGLTLAGAAFAGFSLANGSPGQWLGLWFVFGLCALMIKSTVWSAGTSSVFTTSRGLALAAVLSGSALGQILAPIVANTLIEAYGWRSAFWMIGFGWAGIGLALVILLFYDAPALAKRGRLAADQAGTPKAVPVMLTGLTVREALRDQRLIRIAVANLAMGSISGGISAHLLPLIAETGIKPSDAAQMAASAGVAGIIGKFLTGWLLDRYQGSFIPFFSFGIAALGHFLLLDTLKTPVALTAGAMILGYSAGAGLQVTTYLVSRYAGLKKFGTIFGTIASMMLAGSAIGPLLAGKVHDISGSYTPILLASIPTMIVSALLFVRLGPYPVFAPAKDGPVDDNLLKSPA